MKGKVQKIEEEDSEEARAQIYSMTQRECEVRASRDRISVDAFHHRGSWCISRAYREKARRAYGDSGACRNV